MKHLEMKCVFNLCQLFEKNNGVVIKKRRPHLMTTKHFQHHRKLIVNC